MSSMVESMSTPMKHGYRIGGLEMRMWISLAPAARSRSMMRRDVVPRTIESSTAIRRLPLIERGSGLSFRIADRRGCAGVWEGDDHVSIDRRLLRELMTHPDARVLQLAVLEDGVRPGEVDELEDAHRVLVRWLEVDAVHAVL